MAEFSKQWCELNDSELPWDFDIIEEAVTLEPNSYIPMICEGFGFLAIGKNEDGDIMVAMPVDDDNFKWTSLDEVINK
jgi:hypothetical protein